MRECSTDKMFLNSVLLLASPVLKRSVDLQSDTIIWVQGIPCIQWMDAGQNKTSNAADMLSSTIDRGAGFETMINIGANTGIKSTAYTGNVRYSGD